MTDVPDDLTTDGRHRGGEPPEDTGRTVRSPEGPDPASGSAQETPALFQVMRADSDGGTRIRIRLHPPRRMVEEADEGYEEVAQVYTPGDLEDVLADLPDGPYHMVFETRGDAEDEADVYLENDAALDHPWLFQDRYEVVTLFSDKSAATGYLESLE